MEMMKMLEGMNELFATLDSLGGNIRDAAKRSIQKSAKRIQGQAKMLAPVKTGTLRNSIRTKANETEDGVEAKVYTNLEYAPYVEWGTGERGAASNIGHRPDKVSYKAEWPGQAAQPYMSPAYLYSKNNNIVEKDLSETLQQEIKKLERGKG